MKKNTASNKMNNNNKFGNFHFDHTHVIYLTCNTNTLVKFVNFHFDHTHVTYITCNK